MVLNLPNELRKVKWLRYCLALFEAVKLNFNEFLLFRQQQLYEAKINGRAIILKKFLNDTFDPIQRRIYITDGDYFTPPIFYEEYKNLPVIFYNEGDVLNPVFNSDSSIDDRVNVNFYVHVPSDIFFDRTHIRAEVKKHKIFGRTFDIILIP